MSATKTDRELVSEYFHFMVGKNIESVAIAEDEALEITLQDGSVVVIWSSEDLSLAIDYNYLN